MANRHIPPMPESKIRALRHQTVDGVDKYKVHRVGHVIGLSLKCNPPKKDKKTGEPLSKVGSRSWILHYTFDGEPDTKGMGSYPTVPTVQAVKKSQAWREKLDQGINPKEDEKRRRKEAAAKALGTGFRKGVYWRDLEIVNEPSGKPTLEFHGKSKSHLLKLVLDNDYTINLSITDEFPYAQAIVTIN